MHIYIYIYTHIHIVIYNTILSYTNIYIYIHICLTVVLGSGEEGCRQTSRGPSALTGILRLQIDPLYV